MPKLLIDIEARFAQFQDSLNRIEAQGASAASRIGSAFGAVTKVAGALGVGVAAGALVGGLRSITEQIDAFNDAADATGASVEVLSGLDEVARRNGGSLDDVSAAITKLNQALGAKADSEQAKALAAIGLSADELRAKDPGTALKDVADALANYENNGQKARVMQDLFGKSAGQLAPLLGDIAEAGELNVRVTAQQAEEAARFQKAISRLEADLNSAGRAIGLTLVPALNNLIERMRVARDSGQGFFTMLSRAFDAGDLDQSLTENVNRISQINAELIKLQQGGGGTNETFNRRRIDALKAERAELQAEGRVLEREAEMRRRLRKAAEADSGSPTGLPEVGGGSTGSDSAAEREAKRIADLRLLAAEQLLGIDEASQQFQQSVESAYEAFDRRREKSAEAANDATFESLKRLEDMIRKYEDLADPTAVYMRQVEEINALEAQGYLNAEKAFAARGRLYEDADRAAEGLNKTLEKQKSIGEELGLTFTSAFEDAIVKGASFRDVLEGIAQDIVRIVVRRNITEPLGRAIADFDWGSLFGGGRATGGPVRAGMLYEVNEQSGPGELLTAGGRTYLMANQDGYVTPTVAGSAKGAGGAATQINVQIINNTQSQVSTARNDAGDLVVLIDQIDAALGDRVSAGVGATSAALQGRFGLRPAVGGF